MELRKDYILDRYVIVSDKRGKRPIELKPEDIAPEKSPAPLCYFCPGNESMTPAEKGRFSDPWHIRWFDNKFQIVEPKGNPVIRTDNKYFTFSDAYGHHEVIVDSRDHSRQLQDLSESEMLDVLKIYRNRMVELAKEDPIRYVHLFKNFGKDAGASIRHSHTQIISLNHVPRLIQEEIDAVKKFHACPFCEILNIEKNSDRRCFENSDFVAFTPYASRFNYEIWVLPKRHLCSMDWLDDILLANLATILKQIFSRMKILGCDYNFTIHYTPKNSSTELHLHLEIMPRIAALAGVELGSETYVNIVSPETAAKFYRREE